MASGADAQFASGAAEYLQEKNFKSLAEYLSAEVLFKRPEDPLVFLRDVLDHKIKQRGSDAYDPKANDEFLKSCYANPLQAVPASSSAAAAAGGAGAAAPGAGDANVEGRLTLLENLIKASRSIAMELDPIKATVNIISEACGILSADRATIFKMDETGEQLEIMVAEGASGIRVPVGKGIAGTVAASGELENIKDAYEDARFDSTFDKKSGYRTESVLAAPVRDGQGAIVGVLQVINKLKDPKNKDSRIPFSDMDVEVANILAAQAGIALRNAELYKTSRRSQEKVRALIEVIKSMYSNLGINSLMFTITQRAPALVDAERCTFFLANHKSKELWAMQGDVDIRIPIDKGIAGAVATSGKMITIKDAYEDERFNQAFDKKSGFRTRQILCMPLLGSARGASAAAGAAAAGSASGPQVVGVIQLINKSGTLAAFSDEDIEIVNTFLTLAAPILEASDLFQSKQSKTKAEESGEEFSGGSVTRAKPARDAAPAAPIIEEGDEEEEDD